MKYLIAGLGNPGPDYENTRHNIGFKVLDALARESGTFFSGKRHGDLCEMSYAGKKLLLLKPSTYMNLSGKALAYWMQAEKIPLEHILVITDDLSLPFGKQRLRTAGSAGGHNGLKSIQFVLNTEKYARLRIGIGNDFATGKQVDYVLGHWTTEEADKLPERIGIACDTARSFVRNGPAQTMTLFNSK